MQALLDDLGQADSMYKSMYDSSKNSTGSAMDENEKFMKSLQARINLARVEVEKLALAFGDAFLTEGMIQGIKAFSDFLSIISKFTEKFGALPAMFGVTGAALFLLSSRFRGLVSSIATGTASLFGFTTATRATTAATAGATAATNGFKISLRGLMAATGVGLVLVGIGAAMEALLGNMAKTSEVTEEMATENKALLDSYNQNGEQVNQLASEYGKLEKAMQNDPDLSTQERYFAVQNELAGLMPHLVQGEDSYGNKVLGNASVIQSRIELIKQQVEAEKALQDIQNAEDSAEKIKAAEKELEKNKKLAGYQLGNAQGKATDSLFTGFALDKDTEIKNLQDIENAIAHFQAKRKELYDSGLTDKSPKLIEVNDTISDLTNIMNKYSEYTAKVNSAQTYLASANATTTAKLINDNQRLSESTKQMATGIVNDLSLAANGADELKSIGNVFSDIDTNSKLADALNNMNNEISSFQKNAETDFSKIEKSAESTFEGLKNSIMSASGIDTGSDTYAQLSAGLDAYVNKLLISEQAIRNEASAKGVSIEAARADIAAHDETGIAIDEEISKRYALSGAIDTLSGVNQNAIADADELLWQHQVLTQQLGTLTEGTYEYDAAKRMLASTEETLLGLYPEMFHADATSLAYTDDKIGAIRAEVEANDILRAAYSASRDGKLTSEQEATIANLENTNNRIKNINAEITALNKLAQAYRAFASSSIETANELAKAGLDSDAQDAEIRARKFNGYAVTQEQASSSLQAQLAKETAARTQYTNILKGIPEVLDRGTTSANKNAAANRKAADSAGKGSKAAKDKAKAEEEVYETITKNNEAIEKAIFLANKYEEALEKVTLAIQKQESITSKLPDYSKEYRASLAKEIKLQKDKLKILSDQSKSLEDQIKKGKIIRYGVNTETIQEASTTTSTVRKLAGWDGATTSGYGMRVHPITGKWTKHAGIDIDGKTGDRLDANVAGNVLFAGDAGNGFGKYVMVEAENGIKHIYAHLSKVAVKIGDKVATGMKLGEIGSTGNSTGSHLHYETRDKNNQSFDPSKYLSNARAGNTVYSSTSSGSGKYSGKYASEINKAASKYGVDPNLIAAMIKQESNFNPNAVSHAGARGLMQLMPATARELGVKNSFNAEDNIMGGTKYIAQQIKAFGSLEKALAAYNAGAGNVRKYGGIPPFKETQNYVKKVTANYESFKASSGSSSSSGGSSTTTTLFKDEAATQEAIAQANSQVRDLQGNLVSIKDAIAQLEYEIVNSQLQAFEYERDVHGKNIRLIEEKIQFLENGRSPYLKYIQQEVKHMNGKQKVNQKELDYLTKQIASNKLNAAAVYELKERVYTLREEMVALDKVIADTTMRGYQGTNSFYAGRIEDLEFLIGLSKSYADTLSKTDKRRGTELAKQVHHIEHQQDLLRRQRLEVEKMLKNTKITADQHKELEEVLEDIIEQYWSLEDAQREINGSVADDAIARMKEVYEKQRELALKAIDDERDAYQKMIDDKIKMLDEQADKEDHLRDQKEKQDDMAEIRNKINLLSLDDSQYAKAEKAKLLKELEELEKDYAGFMRDKEREDRKKALEEELKDKEDELDKEQEKQEKFYENILEDERKWAKMREDIIKGVTKSYITELENMSVWTNKNLEDIGKSIGTNLIDNLNAALIIMKNVTSYNPNSTGSSQLAKDEKTAEWTDNPVPAKKSPAPTPAPAKKPATTTPKKTSTPAKTTTPAKSTTKYHTIKKGDNFWDLENKYGLSHGTLAKLNPSLNPNNLKVGQKIVISKSGGTTTAPKTTTSNANKRKTSSAVNMRSSSSYGNNTMLVIPKGKTVDYLGMEHGWAKVKYGGKTGYVGSSYLQKFDVGGYTGDNVPKEGALAVLHKKEQVLNADDTTKLFKTIELMHKIHSKIKSFAPPSVAKQNGNESAIGNLIHIENFHGTKKEVDNLASTLTKALSKKGVTHK